METPPHDLDAETAVLGAALLNVEAADALAAVPTSTFYNPRNGHIAAAICELLNDGVKPDVITVGGYLKDTKTLEDVGGQRYLLELQKDTPSISGYPHYISRITKLARRRAIYAAATQMVNAVKANNGLETAVAAIEEAVQDPQTNPVMAGSVLTHEIMDSWERSDDRLACGFGDIDRIVGGFEAGGLIVIGARPGHGKTALALGVASNILDAGGGVLFVSLEMPAHQLGNRLINLRAEIGDMRTPTRWNPSEAQRASDQAQQLGELPLTICEASSLNITELAALIRSHHRRKPLSAVFVDYLQLVTATAENRRVEVEQVSRTLKNVASALKVPVFVLCQLSRSVDDTITKEPELHHLKESGEIEAAADVVIGLVRPEMYDPENAELTGIAHLGILKNRHGDTGRTKLVFRGRYGQFKPMANPGVRID